MKIQFSKAKHRLNIFSVLSDLKMYRGTENLKCNDVGEGSKQKLCYGRSEREIHKEGEGQNRICVTGGLSKTCIKKGGGLGEKCK